MPEWVIYYSDGSVVRGETLDDWLDAPEGGVQCLVLFEPHPEGRYPWAVPSKAPMRRDRQVWTGDETYSLNAWPKKTGSLIERAAYDAIFERSIYDEAS